MMHSLSYVVFALLFTSWLGRELKRTYNLKTYWKWILSASLATAAASIFYSVAFSKFSNFILHASGGMAATFLFIYTMKTLKLHFTWPITTLLLFFFVSTTGVLNELMEYAFETLGFGIMSFDSHDTWRDFVANTTGMILAWTAYCIVLRISHRKVQDPLY